MIKIHGFPGIGTTGNDGIKGEYGISNYFIADDKDVKNIENNSFYFDKELNKFYINDEGKSEKISLLNVNNSLFNIKNDIVYTFHNLSLRDDLTINKILKNKYSLSFINSKSDCNFITVNNKESVCDISSSKKDFKLSTTNTPLIINSLFIKNKEQSFLNDIQSKLNIKNSNIQWGDDLIVVELEELDNSLLSECVEVSLIINCVFDNKTFFNEEKIIKPFFHNKLNNNIEFKIGYDFSQYEYSIYYKIKVIQTSPLSSTTEIDKINNNIYTLYKKVYTINNKED